MAKLIQAYDTRTHEVRLVPENWFDHDEMSKNLKKGKPPAAKAEVETTTVSEPKQPKNSTSGEPKTPQGGEK